MCLYIPIYSHCSTVLHFSVLLLTHVEVLLEKLTETCGSILRGEKQMSFKYLTVNKQVHIKTNTNINFEFISIIIIVIAS